MIFLNWLKSRKGLFLSFFMVVSLILLGRSESVRSATKSRFEKLELFNKVLYLIESQYYRDVDTGKLIAGAINGMMQTLDPHSAFLRKDIFEKMQEDTQGEFGGIGIEVTQKDGILVVITPIEDTPAYLAGIKSGDKVVEINHDSTIGITLEQAVEKMKGKPGSKVNVGVVREGVKGIKYFKLKRKKIKIDAVKSALVSKGFIYIRLVQFQKNSAKSIIANIKKITKKIKNKSKTTKVEGVILDLRANPGGLLDEAVNVSSLFLKDGVVVSTEGRNGKNKEIRYVKKTGFKDLNTPLVILINGASASASEIVAGAIQDHGRGIIMGTQSFGKGSVQTVAKIDDEKGIKLTIAQYMTPKNRKIQAIGIVPDVMISEVDGEWVTKHGHGSRYIRESDLRNHLTATFETEEEKVLRLKREKEKRKQRIAAIQEEKLKKQESKSKKDDAPYKKYDANKDYQVLQAVNYLKSYSIMKKL
jgi:carboxyl-terminal processing protease